MMSLLIIALVSGCLFPLLIVYAFAGDCITKVKESFKETFIEWLRKKHERIHNDQRNK